MSSRNVYLTTDQRLQALGLHKAIRCTSEEAMADFLDDHGLEVEYAVIRDSGTLLAPVDGQTTRALIAVRLGHIRLIDNGIVNQ